MHFNVFQRVLTYSNAIYHVILAKIPYINAIYHVNLAKIAHINAIYRVNGTKRRLKRLLKRLPPSDRKPHLLSAWRGGGLLLRNREYYVN